MGHGIAYLLAAAGHQVAVFEPSPEIRALFTTRLQAIVDLLENDATLLQRIATHDTLAAAVQGAAFVFEAAPEKLPLKQTNLRRTREVHRAGHDPGQQQPAIPSTEIGRHLKHRDKVLGTHFWNPRHLVPLVEVTQNEMTSPDVVQRTIALLRDAGKTPVHVRRDVPGFVGNRLQHAMKREAIALVAAGVCDADTIDVVVARALAREPPARPDGANRTSSDQSEFDIAEVLYADLDRTPGPHPYLRDIVAAGKLGMTTGEGLRKWTPKQADAVRARLSRFLAEQAKARNKARQQDPA